MDSEDPIYAYRYRTLKTLLKTSKVDPEYAHRKANVLGEVYEHAVYERLIDKYRKNESLQWFALKGPYVKDVGHPKVGFGYDKTAQMYYFSDEETLAEFDALAMVEDAVVFFEITQIADAANAKFLNRGLRRKKNLLRLLFGQDVKCTVIAPRVRRLRNRLKFADEFQDISNDFVVAFDHRRVNTRKIDRDLPEHFVDCRSIDFSSFDYRSVLVDLHRDMWTNNDVGSACERLQTTYGGLMEHLFLGRVGERVPVLKLGHKGEPSVIWLYEANGKWYDSRKPDKPIPGIKRIRRELRCLSHSIPELSDMELSQLLSSVPAFR